MEEIARRRLFMPAAVLLLAAVFFQRQIQIVQILNQFQELTHIFFAEPVQYRIPEVVVFFPGLLGSGFPFRGGADGNFPAVLRIDFPCDIILLFQCIQYVRDGRFGDVEFFLHFRDIEIHARTFPAAGPGYTLQNYHFIHLHLAL